MNKRVRVILILIAVAVALYFVYRWWQNRQSAQGNTGSGLGSNLNSVAPELVGGSSGPMSGLNYYAGSTPVTVELPNGNPSQTVVSPNSSDEATDNDRKPKPKPKPRTGRVPHIRPPRPPVERHGRAA